MGIKMLACNPSTSEIEAGEWEVQDNPKLHKHSRPAKDIEEPLSKEIKEGSKIKEFSMENRQEVI